MPHHRNWQFWRAKAEPFDPTAIRPEAYSLGQLRAELEQHVAHVLRKAGVDLSCVAIEVTHQTTTRPGSLPQLACMLPIVQWERRSVLRLLLGVAYIERAMRREVQASWLGHAILFGGVWVHASDSHTGKQPRHA